MLDTLKHAVFEANQALVRHNLVVLTWGNVSAVDENRELMVIKPSGMAYSDMTPADMVVVDLKTRRVVEGMRKPSSDTPTHLALYRSFPALGSVVHTHSRWATIFAQLCRPIPPLGTTHADHFYGAIPVTRALTPAELAGDYEYETGRVIAETFAMRSTSDIPAVLVAHHGPFTWGSNTDEAVQNAVALEEVAFMAWHSLAFDTTLSDIPQVLLDRHYNRKHGVTAYYGQ